MYEITTEMIIDAPAQRVWNVIIDFAQYPAWNPFIPKIEGAPTPGSRLKVAIRPPGGQGMTFKPVVLKADPNRELRWLGHLLLPGIFDGEHYFMIEPVSESRIRFVHGERFKGILVALIKSSLEGGTRAGFEAMNKALKARAETGK